jgi:aryl-alcohol dehydrogenase-like predicted oxidoreductase
MNQRVLGNTGIKVSEIAFGGVEIGMPYGLGVHGKKDMLSKSESIHLLHDAIDGGINLFDTARMYGASEEIMGKAFKNKRDQVVISTKCKHLKDSKGDLPSGTIIKNKVRKSLSESLVALQTDFVDIFMLHRVNKEILKNEAIKETFLGLKEQGVIRATGISTYTLEESILAIESGVWDVIQIPFNLMDQSQESIFELAKNKGVGLMVRSALFKGILTDKGRDLHTELNGVAQHIKLYDSLLDHLNTDLATLATKFALSYKQISSVLVGIDKQHYLKNALSVADGQYLNSEQLQLAKELQYPNPEFLDLVKWDKMGWLK